MRSPAETFMAPSYASPADGLPGQMALHTGRATFTEAYALIPRGVQRNIVTSYLPHWSKTRAWVLARPMTGFSETFAQMILEVFPEGGSEQPEPEAGVEGVIFVLEGQANLVIEGKAHLLKPGGYAFLPPGCRWNFANKGTAPVRFSWVRKRYEAVDGIAAPTAFVANEQDEPIIWMPDTNNSWGTTRFVDPTDLRHDMHVNIVTLEPGAVIPFEETHVMEHGLLVLEGKAVYRLNRDWVEVEAGDFMWLRAFCPQACYAGPQRFRYLLYKDVNRHMKLSI
jgi:(S)-ureidoglycine aminohydrolase